MKDTKIEWCDSTWNPVTGCRHGCEYCYARRQAQRFAGYDLHGGITTNCPLPRAELTEPLTITRKNGKTVQAPYPFGFEPTFHKYRLSQPKKWHEPQNIFVCSMADLFGDWVPDEWIRAVFRAAEAAPIHRYIFLTKNPKRLCQIANEKWLPIHDNWWYGTSVTNRNAQRYPGRILDHTVISIEPLLERLDVGIGSFGGAEWIIIGAETGNRKDKVKPEKEWVDNICRAADLTQAAVFMKDSLIPVVGEENMRREFPWDKKAKEAAGDGDPGAAQDTLQPTT